jgi:hypothetical protein
LCDDGASIDVAVTCGDGTATVRPHVCSGTDPAFTTSFLQVAVWCLSGNETSQARYTDKHTFGFFFDEQPPPARWVWSADEYDATGLVQNCGKDYLLAARWMLGDVPRTIVQAQCVPAGTSLDDCEAPEEQDREDLSARFRLYSVISPEGGNDATCFPNEATDFSRIEVRTPTWPGGSRRTSGS